MTTDAADRYSGPTSDLEAIREARRALDKAILAVESGAIHSTLAASFVLSAYITLRAALDIPRCQCNVYNVSGMELLADRLREDAR